MMHALEPNSDPQAGVARPAAGSDVARPRSDRELSEADRRRVAKLRETDQRVRRHEEAHRAAAGALYRGGPNYSFETGPDGKRYAVAGSVSIDTSPGSTPQETVRKAAQIRRAALAPVDPSGADRAVAAKASRMEDSARRALVRESLRESSAEAPDPLPADEPDAEAASGPGSIAVGSDADPPVGPSDVGGEVWADVSALNSNAAPRREREHPAAPDPGSRLDVLA